MSEQETKESLLSKDETRKVIDEQYEAILNYVNKLMADCTSRNIQRALNAALAHQINKESKMKLVHKKEAELGGLIARLLDLRTVLQGINLREQENKSIDNSENV